jgi:beta-lactamase regulating signal transducer with metallopeptidase domain
MTSIALVNGYLCVNVLLAVAACCLWGLRFVNRKLRQPLSGRQLVQLAYVLVVAALLSPLIELAPGKQDFMPYTAQVWSGATMQAPTNPAAADHQLALSVADAKASMPLSRAVWVAGGLFVSGLLVMLATVAVDAFATARVIRGAQLMRRRGRLKILTTDAAIVPFSFWMPGRYFIVIPSTLLLRSVDLHLALRHEAQHHRHGDTKLLYLCQLARALFYWNPAVHTLVHQIRELQEFACDEAVVARRQTSTSEYCRCLLWVAETSASARRSSVQACMVTRMDDRRSSLHRRIEAALSKPARPLGRLAQIATCVVGVVVLAAFSRAFAAPIQDRRISMVEAQQMAETARRGSVFPIEMNERVLTQLNLLLSTPDGRAWLQASIARMGQYEDFISEKVKEAGLPAELMAIPLVESGYRNRPADSQARHGAGLWMFIAPTARQMGLEVSARKDQRLDVPAETDAAVRLFAALHARFNDWKLALLAYNAGAQQVEQGIRSTNSTDAWVLIQHGFENDPDYLARVTAVITILRNPTAID